ncbi:DUF5789 family protein [Halobacterium wangiae]|uniref:DUF5789 family protein n=1 Tax=Halobacterium wangiae TaxID=2902623 RepID=UPI001E502829|nr:hypothetical protein [Halobacterium wangiae]
MASDDDERESSTSGSDVNRQQGVELGELDDAIADHDYPTTSTELVSEYGDYEIDLPGGSQTLEEVLGILDQNDERFEEPEEARQAIYNLVGAEAVGRDRYSDRGGSTPDEGTDSQDESF